MCEGEGGDRDIDRQTDNQTGRQRGSVITYIEVTYTRAREGTTYTFLPSVPIVSANEEA
jgi:hypothetical protein